MFLQDNWERLNALLPPNGIRRVCEAVVGLATPEWERDVRAFFEAKKVNLGGKKLEQYLEQLRIVVRLREREARRCGPTFKTNPVSRDCASGARDVARSARASRLTDGRRLSILKAQHLLIQQRLPFQITVDPDADARQQQVRRTRHQVDAVVVALGFAHLVGFLRTGGTRHGVRSGRTRIRRARQSQ